MEFNAFFAAGVMHQIQLTSEAFDAVVGGQKNIPLPAVKDIQVGDILNISDGKREMHRRVSGVISMVQIDEGN